MAYCNCGVLELWDEDTTLYVRQSRYGNASDPKLAKEWFFWNGKNIGYVAADSTTCSKDPNLTFAVPPGETYRLDATFHNVPWKGDLISLEWESVNPQSPPKSGQYDPYQNFYG